MIDWINTIITTIILIFGVILCGSFMAWAAIVIENTSGNLSGSDYSDFQLFLVFLFILYIIGITFAIHDCGIFIKVF